jgi:putative flippase GtrA
MIQMIEWTCLMWVIYQFIEIILNFVMSRKDVDLTFLFCTKCISFWLTLLLTFNPFLASVVAFNMYLIDMYITNKKITL